MSRAGLDPSIHIDGQPVYIMSGSWEFTAGYPEVTTAALSNGRDTVELYRTQDTSKMYSTFKFDMEATPDAIQLLQIWKARTGALTITAIDSVNGKEVELTFLDGSIDNNPTIGSGNNAKISIEGSAKSLLKLGRI